MIILSGWRLYLLVVTCELNLYSAVLFDTVNSEANMKRIAYVEQCFGSSGQVDTVIFCTDINACKFN
jgi:hypothetical protein